MLWRLNVIGAKEGGEMSPAASSSSDAVSSTSQGLVAATPRARPGEDEDSPVQTGVLFGSPESLESTDSNDSNDTVRVRRHPPQAGDSSSPDSTDLVSDSDSSPEGSTAAYRPQRRQTAVFSRASPSESSTSSTAGTASSSDSSPSDSSAASFNSIALIRQEQPRNRQPQVSSMLLSPPEGQDTRQTTNKHRIMHTPGQVIPRPRGSLKSKKKNVQPSPARSDDTPTTRVTKKNLVEANKNREDNTKSRNTQYRNVPMKTAKTPRHRESKVKLGGIQSAVRVARPGEGTHCQLDEPSSAVRLSGVGVVHGYLGPGHGQVNLCFSDLLGTAHSGKHVAGKKHWILPMIDFALREINRLTEGKGVKPDIEGFFSIVLPALILHLVEQNCWIVQDRQNCLVKKDDFGSLLVKAKNSKVLRRPLPIEKAEGLVRGCIINGVYKTVDVPKGKGDPERVGKFFRSFFDVNVQTVIRPLYKELVAVVNTLHSVSTESGFPADFRKHERCREAIKEAADEAAETDVADASESDRAVASHNALLDLLQDQERRNAQREERAEEMERQRLATDQMRAQTERLVAEQHQQAVQTQQQQFDKLLGILDRQAEERVRENEVRAAERAREADHRGAFVEVMAMFTTQSKPGVQSMNPTKVAAFCNQYVASAREEDEGDGAGKEVEEQVELPPKSGGLSEGDTIQIVEAEELYSTQEQYIGREVTVCRVMDKMASVWIDGRAVRFYKTCLQKKVE